MGYHLGLYEKSMPNDLTIKRKLSEAAAAGYDYLEVSIDETDSKLARLNWSKNEILSLYQAQQETGVPIKSICLSGHRRFPLGSLDESIRKHSFDIMVKAVRLASELGVRIIQIAGYDVYYEQSSEDTKRYFEVNLANSVEVAAREGVILAFETMETPFMDTVKKAMYWVELINSPYLQIYPDIGNIVNSAQLYGTDPVADLHCGAGHLAAIHLKETTPGVYREVPYGSGHVNFKTMARESRKLGVGLFVGEFWHIAGEDWQKTLRQNTLFLREALDSA